MGWKRPWLPTHGVNRRRARSMLGKARTTDPIDAAVVLIATDGEAVVTSDPEDILHLARFANRRILVVQ